MKYRLGLKLADSHLALGLPVCQAESGRFRVPVYCDNAPYLLPTSNQGNYPACVGYTWAACAEVRRWQAQDIYEQVDGLAIYRQAKKLDGNAEDGTTLWQGLAAAQELGFIEPGIARFSVSNPDSAKYAIHRYCGFAAAYWAREDWALPMKQVVGDGAILGPHAVWVFGYDSVSIWHQNSWGFEVGWNGLQKVSWETFNRDFIMGLAVAHPWAGKGGKA